jgi:hypothetical protein
MRYTPISVPTVMAHALTAAASSLIFAPAAYWGVMRGSTWFSAAP